MHPLTNVHTENTFEIISRNMFNKKEPNVKYINGEIIYIGNCGYIEHVKWDEFVSHVDFYLARARDINKREEDYLIKKEI